ncbi:unnamed protein product [Diplocarpon coronariae]|uniref:Uncharacterized protein n=1 Tax=Diplocarpon coronariae TaxID=2795749 RepID=A0A218Z4U7_9HELO|nr:hypothetical protein B2J93_1247 [Marssonina coronariae]
MVVTIAVGPWVSIDASGLPVATYTPTITTLNGIETTINPVPFSLTATATVTQNDAKATQTFAATGGGSFQECHNRDGSYAPFCKPDNGSDVDVDGKYYVTWDRDYFSQKNASVKIVANYVNDTGHGPIAFESSPVLVSDGYFVWDIQKDWLQDLQTNNVTLYLNRIDPPAGAPNSLTGPTVRVKFYEKPIYHQPPSQAPRGQSLYIALPTVFGFVILCLLGGFFWNRKSRQIGLGNVMSRRRGYGAGKSKSQRLGLGKKGADIQLSEREVGPRRYVETTPRRAAGGCERAEGQRDEDGLGSLAGSPTGPDAGQNHLMDELRRPEDMR